MIVDDAVTEWLKDTERSVKVGNLSEQTYQNYRRDLTDFLKFVTNEEITALGAEQLNDVFDDYSASPDARFKQGGKPKARSTVQRFYYSLSRFFNDAVRREWVTRSPVPETYMARGKAKTVLDPRRKSVGVQGANTLPSSVSLTNRDKFILRTLVEAGPRVGELCAADRSDLSFDDVLGCWWLLLEHTKNGVARRVPLAHQTVAFYEKYMSDDIVEARCRPGKPYTLADSERALLRSSRGRRLTPRDVQNLLQRTGRKVGVDVTPHGLRHTAATVLLETGTDVHVVRDLLGHSSIAVTSQYLDTNGESVANAVVNGPFSKN